MKLRTYLSFHRVIVASLVLILRQSDYMALDNQQSALCIPLKWRSFDIMSGKGFSMPW